MSTLGWVWTGVKWLARQVAGAVFKPVDKWPSLDGPMHEYPTPEGKVVSWYMMRRCVKCGAYNEYRALITNPPCPEKLPTVHVELP